MVSATVIYCFVTVNSEISVSILLITLFVLS